ncbi:MAG: T9SS type A sorting domain-containing protein, partial [Bacteroidota bacterium]|nr:T9SS type A sorting domain-containing protein [Bacteroidota bacterium]
PNPAQGVVEVHTTQAGPTHVQLLDALGRSVRTQTLASGQTSVGLAGLAAGSYTLLVQQGEARSFRHLVVQP